MPPKDEFEKEAFYNAYNGLKDLDLDQFYILMRQAYSKAMVSCSLDEVFDYQKFLDKFKSNLSPGVWEYGMPPADRPRALGVDLLEEMHSKLFYIEDMLEKYPEKKPAIAHNLKLLQALYPALVGIGFVPANKAELDSNLALNKLLVNMGDQLTYTNQHATIQDQLRKDTAENVVFSIGSGGNATQMIPPFTAGFAGQVSVYNFDIHHNQRGLNEVADNLAAMSLEHVSPEFFPIRFPSDYSNFGLHYHENEPAAFSKMISDRTQKLVDGYYEVIKQKKIDNPDFRFTILYCCSAAMGEVEKQLAEKLEASGLFKRGIDLELVHAYFRTSPAVVYRGEISKIETPNHILNIAGPDYKIDKPYDAEHDMYLFQRLADVTLFDKLRPKAGSKLKG
jgi:hypothetical protein